MHQHPKHKHSPRKHYTPQRSHISPKALYKKYKILSDDIFKPIEEDPGKKVKEIIGLGNKFQKCAEYRQLFKELYVAKPDRKHDFIIEVAKLRAQECKDILHKRSNFTKDIKPTMNTFQVLDEPVSFDRSVTNTEDVGVVDDKHILGDDSAKDDDKEKVVKNKCKKKRKKKRSGTIDTNNDQDRKKLKQKEEEDDELLDELAAEGRELKILLCFDLFCILLEYVAVRMLQMNIPCDNLDLFAIAFEIWLTKDTSHIPLVREKFIQELKLLRFCPKILADDESRLFCKGFLDEHMHTVDHFVAFHMEDDDDDFCDLSVHSAGSMLYLFRETIATENLYPKYGRQKQLDEEFDDCLTFRLLRDIFDIELEELVCDPQKQNCPCKKCVDIYNFGNIYHTECCFDI